MPPSKKIFIGASLILTGVVFQMLLAYLLARAAGSVAQSGDTAAVDQQLENLHAQLEIGPNAMTLSYVFLLAGVVFFLLGVYQTARNLERLQDSASKPV